MVSCIVAVYNGERYLAAALESILAQTYRPIEVIVVDDGSTDATRDVARRFQPHVTCVGQENAGAPAARNHGLRIARGSYVAFLDADDLWHPEKTAIQMARLDAAPAVEASVTRIENFWSPDVALEDRWFSDDRRPDVMPGYSPVTLLARRSAFEKYGFWDASMRHAANAEWFVRARAAGANIVLEEQLLVRRRLHASNQSRVLNAHSHDEYLRLLKATVDRRRAGGRPPGSA